MALEEEPKEGSKIVRFERPEQQPRPMEKYVESSTKMAARENAILKLEAQIAKLQETIAQNREWATAHETEIRQLENKLLGDNPTLDIRKDLADERARLQEANQTVVRNLQRIEECQAYIRDHKRGVALIESESIQARKARAGDNVISLEGKRDTAE